jgi:hypothetical protein
MRAPYLLGVDGGSILLLTPSPAAAGGYSWMDWEKRYHAVGHASIGASKDVWFKPSEAAERALTG